MFLTAFISKAQTIRGKIIDSTVNGIELATIAVLNPTDSSMIQSTLSDSQGQFSFDNIPKGAYLLKIFMIGYNEQFSKIDIVNNVVILPAITLKNRGVNLNEIDIAVIRKNIEFKNGNITVDIENSALATANSAYDLLFKMPGVTIDENDNISIQGKSGVKILIDDRVQQMPQKQLINLLKGMNSTNIQKIEILKNPSVKYDAAGTGGLINIRTKKAKLIGFSGDLNASCSQGTFPIYNLGGSINYKGKKMQLYSNLNYENQVLFHDHRFDKKIVSDTGIIEMNQKMNNYDGGEYLGGQVGLDWFVNKKNTIGFKIDGAGGTGFEKNVGNMNLSDTALGFGQTSFDTYLSNPWAYLNYNLNAEHLLDTVGSKLMFSADYAPNYDLYDGFYENLFYSRAGDAILEPFDYKLRNEVKCDVLSSKIDLSKKVSEKVSFETGIKGSELNLLSDYSFNLRNNTTGEFTVDSTYSNRFNYNEKIAAGYMNLLWGFGDLNVQGGLRAENTWVDAQSRSRSVGYKRNYFNLFPNLSLEYNPKEDHNFQFSYNRRINRPDYNSFNPYRYRNSLFMSSMGNPNLKPEYSNSFELTHTYKGILSNSIAYSRIDNYLLDLTLQNDSSRETISYIQNLQKSFTLAYSLFLQADLTKWWQIALNGTASYSEYSGTINGQTYFSSGYFYSGNLRNTFILAKKTKLELNGLYIGPKYTGVWYQYARWNISLAIKQTFFKERLNISMGLEDIFFSFIGNNQIKLQQQDWKITATNDSRRFKISLTYNFGKVKVQERDVSSNTEEKGRLGK